jgi:hypothetical protein
MTSRPDLSPNIKFGGNPLFSVNFYYWQHVFWSFQEKKQILSGLNILKPGNAIGAF